MAEALARRRARLARRSLALRDLVVAPGLSAVYRKELADQLGSRRFAILFVLILFAALSSVYVAANAIRDALEQASADAPAHTFLLLFTVAQDPLPPFYQFLSFLAPLVGIALGFDAINSEQERGTLARLLAQPIYRDSVINGKFLARLTTVVVMLVSITVLVGAIGIYRLGIVPTGEEVARLVAFLAVAALFVGFWVAISMAFSVYMRQPATAALAGIATWLFATFFLGMIVDTLANAVIAAGAIADVDAYVGLQNLRLTLARLSPNTLFAESTLALLLPRVRTLGLILPQQTIGMIPNPLALGQSLLLIWPQVVSLLALTAFCFAAAYIRFMRAEVRSL
ncbi:MAG TPA: ABC transporter permease [Candidatus Limnocylindria bacterium]|nr:ABC transporter permease [Candidatus Limnocylindria bacterium]